MTASGASSHGSSVNSCPAPRPDLQREAEITAAAEVICDLPEKCYSQTPLCRAQHYGGKKAWYICRCCSWVSPGPVRDAQAGAVDQPVQRHVVAVVRSVGCSAAPAPGGAARVARHGGALRCQLPQERIDIADGPGLGQSTDSIEGLVVVESTKHDEGLPAGQLCAE